MILSNQVECLSCGDTPWSAHRHDFQQCECGSVAVDGGMDYLRRVYNDADDFKEMSISISDELYEDLVEAINDEGKNDLGKVCTMARVFRDHGIDVGEA